MSEEITSVGPNDRFIADTHFGHQSLIEKGTRAFADVGDHDRRLIEHWNSVVSPGDTVWHLGDFAYHKLPLEQIDATFDRLNGVKRLVAGNHDHLPVRTRLPWASVEDLRVLQWNDVKVVLSHYPMREWPHRQSGAIHLHGHTHGELPSSRQSWDCGVDHQGFIPLTLVEIETRMVPLPELDFRGIEAP